MSRLLPVAMIALACGSSVVYAMAGDWRRSVYWLAAAVLNVTVTF